MGAPAQWQHGHAMPPGAVSSGEKAFRWSDNVIVKGETVRADLSNAGVRDADLVTILSFIALKCQSLAWSSCSNYALMLDFSCNPGITDYGVTSHLVPFLRQWPACRRLKLYGTSIGDESLQALSHWISEGFPSELHLSDLRGPVSGEVVLQLLRKIHRKRRYPYWSASGQSALWLRLEHNGIEDVDGLVAVGQSEGIALRVLEKADLRAVRPGVSGPGWKGHQVEVDLVLFRSQRRQAASQDSIVEVRHELLSLLRGTVSPPTNAGLPHSDPQPLSLDEFTLWTMEAREDEEGGANERNTETFGDDALTAGWSFEENLAANNRLAQQDQQKQPRAIELLPLLGQEACPSSFFDVVKGLATTPGDSHADARSVCSTSDEGRTQSKSETTWSPSPDARSRTISAASSLSNSDERRRNQGDVRQMIEDEVSDILSQTDVLRRSDFDGQVRQWLHAIRTVGGIERVQEALQIVLSAVGNKQRNDVQRWPAYIMGLLKKFHRDGSASKGKSQTLQSESCVQNQSTAGMSVLAMRLFQ